MSLIVDSFKTEIVIPIEGSKLTLHYLIKALAEEGIHEVWWFGFVGKDKKGNEIWLSIEETIGQQIPKLKNGDFRVLLKPKFFPIDFKSEVTQDKTKKYYLTFLMEMIVKGLIYCEVSNLISIISLHLKFRFEKQISEEVMLTTVRNEYQSYLTAEIRSQFSLKSEDWITMIVNMWKTLISLNKHQCLNKIFFILQELDMYGVEYYSITNKKGTQLWLGVERAGLHIYKNNNKMIPVVSLAWKELHSVAYENKKFIINTLEATKKEFIIYSSLTAQNTVMLGLIIGNHQFFLSQRKPDAPFMSKLKIEAKKDQDIEMKQYEDKKPVPVKDEKDKVSGTPTTTELKKKPTQELSVEPVVEKEMVKEMAIIEKDLAQSKTVTTEEDNNYLEIKSSGNNKFSTLKALRVGNTQSRIDQFESL